MSEKTGSGRTLVRRLPPQWKRPSVMIMSIVIALGLLAGFYLLPPESGVYIWSGSIANALLSFFFGYIGAAVYLVIAVVRGAFIVSGFTRHFMIFSLCQFPLGLLIASKRKSIGRLNTPDGIIHFFSFAAVGAFIVIVLRIFLMQQLLRTITQMELLESLCLMAVSISSVGLLGIPIIVLLQRMTLGKDTSPALYKRQWAWAQTIAMPLMLGISILLSWNCISAEMQTYEVWAKIFLNVMSESCLFAGISYLYVRYRKQTLIGLSAVLLALLLYDFIHYDTGEGWIILLPYLIYCVCRLIFFRRINIKLEKSVLLRICLNGIHVLAVLFLVLSVSLDNVSYLLPQADGTENVVIVLGAPVVGPDASGILEDRIDAAKDYAKKNGSCTFYVTGGLKPTADVAEGEYIRSHLIQSNVKDDRIIVESKAKTTQENFKYTVLLMEEKGYSKDTPIVLITSSFHYPRATIFAKDAGFSRIRYVPTHVNWFEQINWMAREVFAYVYALGESLF